MTLWAVAAILEHMTNSLPDIAPDLAAPQASDIARGTLRLMTGLGYAGVLEMTLPCRLRADVVGVGPKGEIMLVEIKSSVADFKSDQKWEGYRPWCDQFYFAVSSAFPHDLIPDDTGLIIADQFGGAVLREAPETPLVAARRKALTLRFGRLAAGRLMTPLIGTDYAPG